MSHKTKRGIGSIAVMALAISAGNVFASESRPLSLGQVVTMIQSHNIDVQAEYYGLGIASEGVKSAEGIFEPELVIDASRNSQRVHNTTEESLSRSDLDEYKNDYSEVGIALETLLSTGAELTVGYDARSTKTNLQENGKEVEGSLELKMTQPLLKGAGETATLSTIRSSEKDRDITAQRYRAVLLDNVASAIEVYRDLQGAQQRIALRQRAKQVAEQLLQEQQNRFQAGRASTADLNRAQALQSLRQAGLLIAQQSRSNAEERLRELLGDALTSQQNLSAEPLADMNSVQLPTLDQVAQTAQANRAELQMRRLEVEREQVKVDYARNKTKPQLDLTLEYGHGGLGSDHGDAFDEVTGADYPSWKVGLEFRMPIFGGQKGKAELAAAQYRHHWAKVRRSLTESVIDNEVNGALRKLENGYQELSKQMLVVSSQESLWQAEQQRMQEGKVNASEVLEVELKLLEAREAVLDSSVRLHKALTDLQRVDGSLLSIYGLDQNPDVVLAGSDS